MAKKGPADPAVAPPNSRLLRISQAAQYLSVTNWFMETLLREKVIPSLFLGKRKVVDVRDIDAWIDRQKQKAVAP
jgi:excisionase family DNA binding protein